MGGMRGHRDAIGNQTAFPLARDQYSAHVILTRSKGFIVFAQFTLRELPGRSNMTWPYTETKIEIFKNDRPQPQPCCVII